MKRKLISLLCVSAMISMIAGCGRNAGALSDTEPPIESGAELSEIQNQKNEAAQSGQNAEGSADVISLSTEVMELERGLSAVQYDGAYGFAEFLAQGGPL